MRRSKIWLVVCLIILSIPFWLAQSQDGNGCAATNSRYYLRNIEAEREVMTRLNRWRMRATSDPLVRNTTLDAMAMDQGCRTIPDAPFWRAYDFHTDDYGDGIAGRARAFGWQSYEFPDQVLASEIAAYYPDIDGLFSFWTTSPPHRAAATEQGFREVGVVVLQNEGWLLAYVVLAGRPDVLPVGYDASRRTLILTTDQSVYQQQTAFSPVRVRILNERREPLHAQPWLVWDRQIPLPANAGDNVIVIVSDGVTEIETMVNLNSSLIFPAVPTPTNQPTPTITPTLLQPTFTALPPTLTPIPSPTAHGDLFDVVMLWDNTSLTIINQSGSPLNLLPLAVVAPDIALSRDGRWFGAYYQGDLEALPAGYCLQAWSYALFAGPPDLPHECVMMASGRSNLAPGQRFWLTGSFNVTYWQQTIAVCQTSLGRCEFDLPTE